MFPLTPQSMNLKISLSGTLLFRRNIFSMPGPSGDILDSFINFLFRNSTLTAGSNAQHSFSADLSSHIRNFKWNSVMKWGETGIRPKKNKHSDTRDFPVEGCLCSSSMKEYFHITELMGYPQMKVNYSKKKF